MAVDIVLIGQNIFFNDHYLSRLAYLTAIQEASMRKDQSHFFQVWLDKAQDDLKRHVKMMKKNVFPEDFNENFRDKM
jgi:hypothetical protein